MTKLDYILYRMNSLNVQESEKRISSLLTTTILPKWKLLTDYSLSLALALPLCLKDHHCRCIGISFSSLKCSCTKNFWHFPEAWILVDGSNFPNGTIEKSKSNWKLYKPISAIFLVILILRVDTLSCFESLNRIDSIKYGKLGHYNVIVGLIFSVVTGSGKIMHGHIFVHAPLIHQALGEKVATLVKNKQTIFFTW